MNFTTTTRVGDIAAANPGAKKVLEEGGVDYCCGGAKSLTEACMHTGVSAEEILRRLQENRQQVGPQDANWARAPLADLTKHIVEKHHKYVRGAVPRVSALLAKVKARGVITTAKGRNVDFVSRCFYPQSGINEDPVTGSAHTILVPYWAKELGKTYLKAMQLSKRKGYLECELKNGRVLMSGNAVTYLKGEYTV